MNLLPKSHREFGSADYWEKFFKKRGQKSFEWYGEYAELCGILHKYIKPKDKVLNIGCGNSTLSADLHDVGYKNIINVDISHTVIRQMTDKYLQTRPDMKYLQMDMLNMEFTDGEFGVVLDKGTLDALFTDDSAETLERIDKMFAEIDRVLRVGGRYVCVSLAQDHILHKVLQHFPELGWMTRICRVTDSDRDDEKEFHMPVFVFVFTKFKKMPNMTPVLEVAPFDEVIDRYKTVEELLDGVKLMQNYGIIRQQLNKGTSDLEEHISLDLHSAELPTPRYTVHVVDSPKQMGNKFAVFIVPEGRETEWLFSSFDGRKELAKSAGFGRLLVVTLHREHTYKSLDDVKAELSGKVMEMAPPLVGKQQVPYLSIGDEITQRVVKFRGTSEFSGDYVVEDVEVDKETYRRLIFMSNRALLQSETKLVRDNTKKKSGKRNTKLVPNSSELCCNYYSSMVAGLALVEESQQKLESELNILLVGLGGGGLATFIHKYFPKVTLDVVEIDKEIVSVATNWFGFTKDDQLKVHVTDGLDFVKQKSKEGTKYHIIMIDVDNKDHSIGISCPPEPFVHHDFLKTIDSCLEPSGVLIVNLSCRNVQLRTSTVDRFKTVFSPVFTKKVPEDVNEIVFAFPSSRTSSAENLVLPDHKLSESMKNSLDKLQSCLHSIGGTMKAGACNVDLIESLEGLTLS